MIVLHNKSFLPFCPLYPITRHFLWLKCKKISNYWIFHYWRRYASLISPKIPSNPSYISTIRRCIHETMFLEAKNILYNFNDLIFRKNSLKIWKMQIFQKLVKKHILKIIPSFLVYNQLPVCIVWKKPYFFKFKTRSRAPWRA